MAAEPNGEPDGANKGSSQQNYQEACRLVPSKPRCQMKMRFLATLLILPTIAWAKTPNAANTVTVHVQTSRLITLCQGSVCSLTQHLDVLVDGKRYELDTEKHGEFFSNFGGKLLKVGDYQATVTDDDQSAGYEYRRRYQFVFPDGKTRTYLVVGEFQ